MKRGILVSLVLLAALAALFVPGVRWRAQALTVKLSGQAPEWAWTDMAAALKPGGWRAHLLSENFVGDTRFVHRNVDQACGVLWDAPLGLFWAPDMRDREYLSWHSRRQQQLEEVNPLMPRPAPADVILEVGGWVGCFTRESVRRGAARVIALEPEPTNRECFEKNLRAELDSGQVELIPKAAWSEPGLTVRFGHPGVDEDGRPSTSLEGFTAMPDGEFDIPTTTIDQVVEQRGLQRLDILQMDIEGTERHAIEGARKTLRTLAPDIILCLHHLPDDYEVLTRLLREINPTYRQSGDKMHGFFVGGRPYSPGLQE